MKEFDYKEFKEEMEKRGHDVEKHGDYIMIEPNNNYNNYAEGFLHATDIIKGYEQYLAFVDMDNYNSWVYRAEFRIIE